MKTLVAGVGMYLLLAGGLAAAEDQQPMPALEAMSTRLGLTAEQEALIEPMLVRRKGELQETRTRLTNLDSRSEKRSVVKYAQQEQEMFNTQVESVLTPAQVIEWRKMRAETRDRLKKYWKTTQGRG